MSINILDKVERTTFMKLPWFMSKVAAGFLSPAQDYVEQTLDLYELFIKRPAATFFVRVEGDWIIEAGVFSNDILIVGRSVRTAHGDVVVAQVNNEFTVKELQLRPRLLLVPRNSAFSPLELSDESELHVFGVVTNVLRQMTRSAKKMQ